MAQQIDQQQAALQAAIAQQGQLGQQRFEAQQKALQDSAQNSASLAYARMGGNAAPPPPGLGPEITAPGKLIADTYAQDSQRAAQAYGNYFNGLNAANNQYMSQVNAAIPIVQARAQAQANRIAQEMAAQERERQAAAEARQLELQSQREAAALQREKQAFERDQLEYEKEKFRQSKSGGGAISNYADTGRALGYNDDLLNYMKNDKVTVRALNQSTGEQQDVAYNPYSYLMQAAQKAAGEKDASWKDVQNAIAAAENDLTTNASTPEQQHGWQNERRLVEEQMKSVFGQQHDYPADAEQKVQQYTEGKAQQQQQASADQQHASVISDITNKSRANAQGGWHVGNLNDFDPAVRDLLTSHEAWQAAFGPSQTDSMTSLQDAARNGTDSAIIQKLLDTLGISDPTRPLTPQQIVLMRIRSMMKQPGSDGGNPGAAFFGGSSVPSGAPRLPGQ